jgi:hypothetical protein
MIIGLHVQRGATGIWRKANDRNASAVGGDLLIVCAGNVDPE